MAKPWARVVDCWICGSADWKGEIVDYEDAQKLSHNENQNHISENQNHNENDSSSFMASSSSSGSTFGERSSSGAAMSKSHTGTNAGKKSHSSSEIGTDLESAAESRSCADGGAHGRSSTTMRWKCDNSEPWCGFPDRYRNNGLLTEKWVLPWGEFMGDEPLTPCVEQLPM
jgi:hypothetical protein